MNGKAATVALLLFCCCNIASAQTFHGLGIYSLGGNDHVRLWAADSFNGDMWANVRPGSVAFRVFGNGNAIARIGRRYSWKRVNEFEGSVRYDSETVDLGTGPGFRSMVYGWVFSHVDPNTGLGSWTNSTRKDEFYVVRSESPYSPAGDPLVDFRTIDGVSYRLHRGTHGHGTGFRFIAIAEGPTGELDMKKFFDWYRQWGMRGFDYVDAVSVGFEIHPGGSHSIRMHIKGLELPE